MEFKKLLNRQSGQRLDHSTSSWRCIQYGNGIGSRYTYDPDPRRVAEIYTSKRGTTPTSGWRFGSLLY